MKLGTIPLKRWHQEGKLNAPSTDDVLYFGRYLVGSVVSCLPVAYQVQNNIAPTAVAVPLLAVAGCIIHAAYAGQEYLLWAPTIDTPEPEPTVEPELPTKANDLVEIQDILDAWDVRAKAVRLITSGKTLNIVELKVNKGVSLKEDFNQSFSRDLDLPRGLMVATEPNIGGGLAAMYIPKPVPGKVLMIDACNPIKDRPFTICPGEAAEGDYPCYDMIGINHVLWAAETGAGKSVAMNVAILQIAAYTPPHLLKMTFLDPKGKELRDYEHLPHRVNPIAKSDAECYNALCDGVRDMKDRERIIGEAGCRDLGDYNKRHPNAPMPYHYIVIDELVPLLLSIDYGKNIQTQLIFLLNEGRSSGIRVWAGTQRLGREDAVPLVRDGFGHYVGLRVKSKSSSRVICDDTMCTKLRGKGDQIVGLEPMNRRRVQGAMLDSEGIRLMIEQIRKKYG